MIARMDDKTEAQVNKSDSAVDDQPGPLSVAATQPLDHFLQSLVGLANIGVEIGLTLTVGGFLISGTLTSGKRYFDELQKSMQFTNTEEWMQKELGEFFRQSGSIYDPPSEEETPIPPPTFLHLRDARFFHNAGAPMPSNASVWWRGRISEVQGFHFGTLTAS
jgi:hypothetical protein